MKGKENRGMEEEEGEEEGGEEGEEREGEEGEDGEGERGREGGGVGDKEGGEKQGEKENIVTKKLKRNSKFDWRKKVTSHPRIAHGQRYPMPCLE